MRRSVNNSLPPYVPVSPSAPVRVLFLSKAKREELALKRRLEEEAAAAEKCRQEQLFSQKQKRSPEPTGNLDGRDRHIEQEKERGKLYYRELDRRRNRADNEEDRKRTRLDKGDQMVEAIKEQPLPLGRSSKPRKRRVSDRFRFSFDWENTDDTSRDAKNFPQESPLLFGRGFRGGIDRREQKKVALKNEIIRRKELGLESDKIKASSLEEEDDGFHDMRSDRRHWSEKKVDEMSERDWRIFREDFNISYKGGGCKIPKPMRSWGESKLDPKLLRAVERAGYKSPSPIQMATIPLGLQQRDVMGIAQTGSGKTAAFVLPMLNYILRLPPLTDENKMDGPYALVMAPTRELAQQIEEETIKFAHYMRIKVVSVVGGQSIEEQGFKIRNGCHVVIATPGRLMDLLERRYIVLNQCNYVVLDEADRMIDMGFEPQVVGVLDAMPSTNLKPEINEDEQLDHEKKIYRITYMFSATMPPGVERLARKYLRNPVVATAGKATDSISQHVIMIKESEKFPKLRKLLDASGGGTSSTMVFVNTKKNADSVTKELDKAGYKVTSLHGGKSQDERETSLEGFRSRRYSVLVATDVAGRGIDIPDVAHVVNYDMSRSIDMYTHRIGRTGRAGNKGVATTFLTLDDAHLFYDIKRMLIQTNSPVPSELARHQASNFKTHHSSAPLFLT